MALVREGAFSYDFGLEKKAAFALSNGLFRKIPQHKAYSQL